MKPRKGAVVTLKADVKNAVAQVVESDWNVRKGRVVPTTRDLSLRNGAVSLTAAYLYADLANSTTLARDFTPLTAAKVIRSFLDLTCRILKANGATIVSFDGDRVMGVFIGASRCAAAVRAALQINYAVAEILRPKVYASLPTLRRRGFSVRHGVGIAEGQTLIVRGGVRGDNDLVSIGRAANVAAKLSDRRDSGYYSFITSGVYNKLPALSKKTTPTGKADLWDRMDVKIGGTKMIIYRSKGATSL